MSDASSHVSTREVSHAVAAASADSFDRAFFGHPRGLATLFLTEMWERFSYHGTRALLILFMTASPTIGGLGFAVPKAAAIYGLYAASVYLSSLPGGWVADRILGLRNAVLTGGVLIAFGHYSLIFRRLEFFYLGLMLIVLGTGLLKANTAPSLDSSTPMGTSAGMPGSRSSIWGSTWAASSRLWLAVT